MKRFVILSFCFSSIIPKQDEVGRWSEIFQTKASSLRVLVLYKTTTLQHFFRRHSTLFRASVKKKPFSTRKKNSYPRANQVCPFSFPSPTESDGSCQHFISRARTSKVPKSLSHLLLSEASEMSVVTQVVPSHHLSLTFLFQSQNPVLFLFLTFSLSLIQTPKKATHAVSTHRHLLVRAPFVGFFLVWLHEI